MAKGLCEPTGVFLSLSAVVIFVPDRPVPQGVEDKTLLLMLAGHRILRAEIERILRLLIEVGSVVEW